MKKWILIAAMALLATAASAQVTALPKPNMKHKTLKVMQALAERKSIREYSPKMLSQQDLSDLLWAAGGVSRPDGRLTAPTAQNKQEIRLFVFTADGVSEYLPKTNQLKHCVSGDYRKLVAANQDFAAAAPLSLVIVADVGLFGDNARAAMLGAFDAGIVSENINIYCAAAGLATVTRATMDAAGIQKLLGLGEAQLPLLNNPVGYLVK